MANSTNPNRRGLVARFDVLSYLAGLAEKIVINYATISSYIGGGALMGWLAYLQEVPPLWWGVAFFSGLLFVAIIRAITRWGWHKEAEARVFDAIAVNPPRLNRLENEFVRQQIRLIDLLHPLAQPLTGKTFIECEIHGPGLMLASGCMFDIIDSGFVELVRLGSDRVARMPNKVALHRCHFVKCKLYNIVIAMTSPSVDEVRKLNPNIPVMGE